MDVKNGGNCLSSEGKAGGMVAKTGTCPVVARAEEEDGEGSAGNLRTVETVSGRGTTSNALGLGDCIV